MTVLRVLVLWYCGTVVLWHCVTVYCGTVVLWYCGTEYDHAKYMMDQSVAQQMNSTQYSRDMQ